MGARFRARFDPQYLGLSLFPERESGLEGRTYREDMERIGARDWEWDIFNEMREERAEALLEFAAIVNAAGGPRTFAKDLVRGSGVTWLAAPHLSQAAESCSTFLGCFAARLFISMRSLVKS